MLFMRDEHKYRIVRKVDSDLFVQRMKVRNRDAKSAASQICRDTGGSRIAPVHRQETELMRQIANRPLILVI